jgi:hypothetical protein
LIVSSPAAVRYQPALEAAHRERVERLDRLPDDVANLEREDLQPKAGIALGSTV